MAHLAHASGTAAASPLDYQKVRGVTASSPLRPWLVVCINATLRNCCRSAKTRPPISSRGARRWRQGEPANKLIYSFAAGNYAWRSLGCQVLGSVTDAH